MVCRNGDGGELLRFFLAEGERMRGGEEVGGGVDFRNSAGETNGGCTAALETSTRV